MFHFVTVLNVSKMQELCIKCKSNRFIVLYGYDVRLLLFYVKNTGLHFLERWFNSEVNV